MLTITVDRNDPLAALETCTALTRTLAALLTAPRENAVGDDAREGAAMIFAAVTEAQDAAFAALASALCDDTGAMRPGWRIIATLPHDVVAAVLRAQAEANAARASYQDPDLVLDMPASTRTVPRAFSPATPTPRLTEPRPAAAKRRAA